MTETSHSWAARRRNGQRVRIAVPAPEDPALRHLAWPKLTRLPTGRIVPHTFTAITAGAAPS